ncbi:MAG: endonuclease/exonuclease/phosphatase family protein, partial [Myxococcales bacterium]|nr:endonuclease/exonuclease/phosphatase family protein [Myxococcales bacterium]
MPAPLTVMTWNVRYFAHGVRGLSATRAGMVRAADTLAQMMPLPDLIALQEVETRSLRAGLHAVGQLERFLSVLHDALAARGRTERFQGLYYPAHRYGLTVGPALYTTGLAILVGPRLVVEDHNAEDPHDVTHVRLSRFQRFKQRRIVGHVRVRPREGGPALDLFNTHLSLPAFLEVGPTQVSRRMGDGSNQLAEIGAVMAFIEAHRKGPAVLVGDFNTRPGSAAYDAVVAAGFHDAYATANDLAPAELRRHATAGFATSRMHIDHVFSTGDVAWEAVHGFPFGDRHAFHGISDHTPKVGHLVLPTDADVAA